VLKKVALRYVLIAVALDALSVLGALALARILAPFWLSLVWPVNWDASAAEVVPSSLWPLVVVMWATAFSAVSVYDPSRIRRARDEFQRVLLGCIYGTATLAGMLYLLNRSMSRWLYALLVVLTVVFVIGWRVIMRLSLQRVRLAPGGRNVLIAGAGKVGRQIASAIQAHDWLGLCLVGFVDDNLQAEPGSALVLGTIEDTRQVIERHHVDELVIALPPRAWKRIEELAVSLQKTGISVRVAPDYFILSIWRCQAEDFAGIPLINLRAPALSDYQLLIKRAFDLVLASVLFVLSLPAMAVIAVAIKLDTPGPAMFRQRRVGENGCLFEMLKFRTMIDGAEAQEQRIARWDTDGRAHLKTGHDPRVTRLGRLLRRTSLDELPQLLNVLKGEMSLVGPRPELPWLVDMYEPWQRQRFAVPQGMTGWWQVNGRSEREMHLHTEDDIYYVANYSVWLDLVILIKTIGAILKGRGAF